MLRGMAIFAMIAANMAAHNLREPHAFLFRLYGSFAAPAFIFLAGMMVSFTSHHKLYPLKYYAVRGFAILVIAALIDLLCWRVIPFITFDVLYLIGIALPLARLFLGLRTWLQAAVLLLLFIAAPVLQSLVGYQAVPVELETGFSLEELRDAPVLKQFLVDGWFPLFPWLGVALLGAFAGKLKISMGVKKANAWLLNTGAMLLIAGVSSWCFFNPELITREGYSELFYPPTLHYLLSVFGLIFILLSVLYRLRDNKLLFFFVVYGRSSLLMYILHTVCIVTVFNVYFGAYGLKLFMLLYLGHALVLWMISWTVQKLKKGKRLPFPLGFLLGG